MIMLWSSPPGMPRPEDRTMLTCLRGDCVHSDPLMESDMQVPAQSRPGSWQAYSCLPAWQGMLPLVLCALWLQQMCWL